MYFKESKRAFTLAEVLIVLVIIGIIAALTVPALINNIRGEEYRTGLKKSISVLNQALTQHYTENGQGLNGILDYVNKGDFDGAIEYFGGIFLNKINGTLNDTEGSFPGGMLCPDDGTILTTDGMIICTDLNWLEIDATHCDSENKVPCSSNTQPLFYVDVNGEKGPNELTTNADKPKDQYGILIYDHKAAPFGVAQKVMYDK